VSKFIDEQDFNGPLTYVTFDVNKVIEKSCFDLHIDWHMNCTIARSLLIKKLDEVVQHPFIIRRAYYIAEADVGFTNASDAVMCKLIWG
jgi:hypothetical protein